MAGCKVLIINNYTRPVAVAFLLPINLQTGSCLRSLAMTLTLQSPVSHQARPGQGPGFICLPADSDCVSLPSGNMSALSGQRSVKIVYGVKISLSLGSQLGLLIPDWR